jgi:hypothetical protein
VCEYCIFVPVEMSLVASFDIGAIDILPMTNLDLSDGLCGGGVLGDEGPNDSTVH